MTFGIKHLLIPFPILGTSIRPSLTLRGFPIPPDSWNYKAAKGGLYHAKEGRIDEGNPSAVGEVSVEAGKRLGGCGLGGVKRSERKSPARLPGFLPKAR